MRSLFCIVMMLPMSVIIAVAIIASSVVFPSGKWMMPLGRFWSRCILVLSGVAVDFKGIENANGIAGPRIYMANHQSALDIPVLALAMPDHLRFLAKSSIRWIPFFGWAMIASRGCIFIERLNRDKAISSLKVAAKRVRGSCSLLIFPEGTRSRTDAMLEFKKGPFYLALEANVPLVPIAARGTRERMPSGTMFIRSGQVTVRFGAPLSPKDYSTPEALSLAVRNAIEALRL